MPIVPMQALCTKIFDWPGHFKHPFTCQSMDVAALQTTLGIPPYQHSLNLIFGTEAICDDQSGTHCFSPRLFVAFHLNAPFRNTVIPVSLGCFTQAKPKYSIANSPTASSKIANV
jgi:hypothetical protein